MFRAKTSQEIESMRKAGKVLAAILNEVTQMAKPGITPKQIDAKAEQMMKDAGVLPSFKGYHGYPAVTCISVNEEVVHTIPSNRELKDGDLVKIDCGVVVNKLHSDAARQVLVGKVSPAVKHFAASAERALYAGIKAARAGNTVYDISSAIQNSVHADKYEVVRELTGHGIGYSLHEEPHIPNCKESFTKKIKLIEGMTIAIEPILTMGKPKIKTLADGWTIVTVDNSIATQSEHTILITRNEPEILTML